MSERAMTPQIDQEWEDRYPASGPTALLDEAVGIGLGMDRAFVAGTRTTASGNSVFALAKYDLAMGGSPVSAVSWPPSPLSSLVRTARKMAVRTEYSSNYSVIAVTGEVPNGSNMDTVTTVYYDHDGSSLDLELTGTATLGPAQSDPYVHTPVAVDISPDGTIVAVLAQCTNSGKPDYVLAAYYTESMQPVTDPVWLGDGGDYDYPTALAFDGTIAYVAGHSGSSASGPFEIFVAAVEFTDPATVVWTERFAPSETSATAAAIAVQFDAAVGQSLGAASIGATSTIIVAGAAHDGTDSDMLTVSFNRSTGAYVAHDLFGQSGQDEGAVSAAGFVIDEMNETDEVPAGKYVYVTGTGETSSNGTDIITMLYKDSTSSGGRHWTQGARWNNTGIKGDEAATQLIITSTDPRTENRTTRAMVGGWTTDGSGNKRFVTVKYDADEESGGNKVPKWVRVEDALSGTYANKSAGIAHRVLGTGENLRLYFGLAGFSDVGSGSSGKDFWTTWFKEESED